MKYVNQMSSEVKFVKVLKKVQDLLTFPEADSRTKSADEEFLNQFVENLGFEL